MPRNAAKKANKNAKRLPVLIKLTNINLNSKKKKLYKNRQNGNKSKSRTEINCTLNNKEIKQRKNNETNEKAIENITFTSFDRIQDKNLASTNRLNVTTATSLVAATTPASTTITTTATTKNKVSKNPKKTFKEEEKVINSPEIEALKNIAKTKQSKSIFTLKESDKTELKEQQCCNFEDYVKNANVACKTEQETNSTLTSLSETSIKLLEPEPLSPSTLRSHSPKFSYSSLYPIVIVSFPQDYKDKEQQQQQQQQQQELQHQQRKDNDTNGKKKKIYSVNSCSSKNRYNNNNNDSNTYDICTCCHTAADTLEQHKSQNNNNNNKSNVCNNNNNNNSYITTPINHSNNSYEQKQSTQSSAKATTKVLTLSKPPPSSSTLSSSSSSSSYLTNQSQEVKARLATLRIRKNKVCQQQEQSTHNTTKNSETPTTSSVAESSESTTAKDILHTQQNKETHKIATGEAGKQFAKNVSSVLDQTTLNLIETLNEEVKKPSNKRKRNAGVLLGLATLQQPRSKRVPSNSLSQVDKPLAGPAATQDKTDQKPRTGNFAKSALVEATNTNSKKRARIMSLYERPFHAANGGRGSVVGNGYMTSSRSSASSGGVIGGALVMNDSCDNQEMANQYYLSGAGVPGSVSTSNPSLLANGSAINHAPSMGTLCNIGNTCYLNSVVYTLRFAPRFLHNLHHLLADLNALQQNIARARAKSSSLGRGISAVHMENARSWSSKDLASMEQYSSGTTIMPSSSAMNSTALTQVTQKTSHQVLTEKLHELYQSLHRNEINESMDPHHADTLLHAIQDVSAIFEGNQQQDAHEFLMCLLNSIRETSQTLIKAIAECPDVILNGYISNPDEIERELMKSHATGGNSGIGIGGTSSSNSNSLTSASSKTSSFFSRKSKRKDEGKNSKNSRLQSPLKDALVSGHNPQTTTTANSLFYLNTNDLNLMATTPAAATSLQGMANSGSVTSPSNSSSSQLAGAGDETDAPTSLALLLKDKQRLEGRIKELGLDFFNEDFEGITVSTTKCLSCETITEQKETMIDIAVPVPQAGYESKECKDRPSSFIQNSCITREYFRHENKYRCEQCCGYTEAIRSISYEVLPRLLIIQLSRFSGGMEKINSYIPTSFTLQCFCSKCCELSDANKLHIYKLYSVITHVGATMSVGHYIAYTCSLEWANEYINCPKEQRRRASQERNLGTASNGSGANSAAAGGSSHLVTASSGLSSSSTSFMKMKMKFGRSKASSSGDMSKNVKQLNGLNAGSASSSKTITNGIGKLTMNNAGSSGSVTPQCPITCQSINCCAMRLTLQQQLQYQSANSSTSDFSEDSAQYSNGSSFTNQANYNNNLHHNFSATASTSGYGSTGRGASKASYGTIQNSCSEPIWYMCDDDKIKAMTQKEFEELLSPARKITVTPYLLFYARYNLQSSPPKSATASTSSPGPAASSPQTSWSNESLQSSGHSAHSSGMRM